MSYYNFILQNEGEKTIPVSFFIIQMAAKLNKIFLGGGWCLVRPMREGGSGHRVSRE